MINLDNFSERLDYIVKHYELTASALADRLDVQRSSISHLQSGRNKPSLEFITKLMEVFPALRFEWLVYGQEPVFKTDVNSDIQKPETTLPPILFDDIEEKTEKQREIKKTLPDVNAVTAKKSDKVLNKIILLYTDGSFEVFNNSL